MYVQSYVYRCFYGFLRIGEITATKQAPNVLQLSQVTKLSNASGFIVSVKLIFHQFKHHYNQPPVSIILSRQAGVWPVENLLRYFPLRGSMPGPLFQHLNGVPVTRTEFDEWLARVIKHCGLDSTKYKGHSFRIGAASHAAACGYSDSQIRLLGRWKSDAFKRYSITLILIIVRVIWLWAGITGLGNVAVYRGNRYCPWPLHYFLSLLSCIPHVL